MYNLALQCDHSNWIIIIISRARLTGSCCVAATWLLATDRPAGGGAPAALRQGTYAAANCIIIDHFSAFESGLVAPFLYAA